MGSERTPEGVGRAVASEVISLATSVRRRCLLMVAASVICGGSAAEPPRRPADRTVVCRSGVLRWKDTGGEVRLFGVNYYAPFAGDYAALKTIGADPDTVIRRDVAHFVRMRLDVIRLHCFDREISDRDGNLVDNEHLRLLDLLLAECKRVGIYAVLTPIAWWPTGRQTEGFSDIYPMHRMTADRSSWPVQRRYLAQFVRHRNRYTGLAYADDPAIAALELINEPIVPDGTSDAQVTSYIDALTDAIRAAGCRKPVFYNGWGGRLGAVRRSRADGATFGWYPTGLASGHALPSNFLPRVADYPEMRSLALGGKAVGVYEFDAADVAEGYMYPAMARSFRAGGAQFAAQFQYDLLPLASTNVDWQTHYLNLVYTPHKAISFLIASDAFHTLPRHHGFRLYPANSSFGEFRVSWDQALSERVSTTAFLYSNDTATRPPAPARLERIAGCGSSPLVRYAGTGAYFLDKVSSGIWRLEVYPDVVWVDNPFGATSLGREVARIYWNDRPMRLSLPDLGARFRVRASAPRSETAAVGGSFAVRPGVYYLRRNSAPARWPRPDASPFYAPPPQPGLRARVWYDPPSRWIARRALPVAATVAPATDGSRARHRSVTDVSLQYRSDARSRWSEAPMRQDAAYHYAASIPAAAVAPGAVQYRIRVRSGGTDRVYPSGISQADADAVTGRTVLFAAEPASVAPALKLGGAPGQTARAGLVELPGGGRALRMEATGFGDGTSAAGLRLPVQGRPAAGDIGRPADLIIRARALRPQTSAVEVGLVYEGQTAYGFQAPLCTAWRDIRVPLSALYPLWGTAPAALDLSRVHEVSLVFGAWLYGGAAGSPHALEVASIAVEPERAAWSVPIQEAREPIVLMTGETEVAPVGSVPTTACIVGGSSAPARRVSVERFGPPPSCTSFRLDLTRALLPWHGHLAGRSALRIRARAGEPATSAFELVLLEEDGTPWGANVKLTSEMRDIRLRWSDFRFFSHWDHPRGRGGPGDRLRPERISAMNVCFGAWLFPGHADDRHAVEIEGVWIDR